MSYGLNSVSLGTLAAGIGKLLGLPDFGVSTYLNGVKTLFGSPAQASTGDDQPNFSPTRQESNLNQGTFTPTSGSGNKQASGGNAGSTRTSREAKAIEEAQKKLREQIKNSFSSTIENYKKQINALPSEQQDSMSQIDTLANSQTQSITDVLNQALARFSGYREQVASNQKQTLQDLADNTRNLFFAGNNYLGARGAGNSSATGMYSAALTQQANKQRGDIQRQTNEQYNNLNISEQETRNEAQNKINEVHTWANTQKAAIIAQYRDLKRQLESAYANASDAQKAAIANYNIQLANQAEARLSQIEAIRAEVLRNFGLNLSSASDIDYTSGINSLASGAASTVKQQTYTLNGMQIDPASIQNGQSTMDGYVGLVNGLKVKSDDGINWYYAF